MEALSYTTSIYMYTVMSENNMYEVHIVVQCSRDDMNIRTVRVLYQLVVRVSSAPSLVS